MTKKQFLEKIKDAPDDAPIFSVEYNGTLGHIDIVRVTEFISNHLNTKRYERSFGDTDTKPCIIIGDV